MKHRYTTPLLIGTTLIVLVAIVAGLGVRATPRRNHTENIGSHASAQGPSKTATTSNLSTTQQTTSSYSLADVAQHHAASSCWTAINGSVYDLTSWIGQHPGGEQAILSICGIDGSAAFNAQHGGQRKPERELQALFIGSLRQS